MRTLFFCLLFIVLNTGSGFAKFLAPADIQSFADLSQANSDRLTPYIQRAFARLAQMIELLDQNKDEEARVVIDHELAKLDEESAKEKEKGDELFSDQLSALKTLAQELVIEGLYKYASVSQKEAMRLASQKDAGAREALERSRHVWQWLVEYRSLEPSMRFEVLGKLAELAQYE